MAVEVIGTALLIGGLVCLLDTAINRAAETAPAIAQIACPYCGKSVSGADLLDACRGCGRYVCPCCRIHDDETLCQDCYIDTRIGRPDVS